MIEKVIITMLKEGTKASAIVEKQGLSQISDEGAIKEVVQKILEANPASIADYKAGKLAIFVCKVNGETKYVMPVYGMGLWGPIWGYIAVNADKTTVFGAYFNHDSETAGLGAEIKDNTAWQEQFRGKKIFKNGSADVALSVLKKSDVKDPTTQCDAVTGATLTSNGVSAMLKDCLSKYKTFLNEK